MQRIDLERKFTEACTLFDAGQDRKAFRLFQDAARAGHRDSQLNVGYCFDVGRGVRRSRKQAFYWYRKAASKGDGSAANNIGTIYRDEDRPHLAARWFEKAASLGATDALLNLAKLFMGPLEDPVQARRALLRLARAKDVSEDTSEQAEALLRVLDDSRSRRSRS